MNLGLPKGAFRWAVLASLPFSLSLHGQTPAETAASSGNRTISGTVASGKTGHPLAGAEMTLTDAKDGSLTAETMSDEAGNFVFRRIADGRYNLRAFHRGYIRSALDEHDGLSTAVVTGEGLKTTEIRFPLAPQGVIFGAISEDSGDAVPDARITLYRVDRRSGVERTVRAANATSDNQGNYEFSRLEPGNYYVAVSATPWYATHSSGAGESRSQSALDVAYATTFYPGVADWTSATPIPVAAGERIPVNFTLHPVPAVHLKMEIPRGAMEGNFAMPRLHEDAFGISDLRPAGFSFYSPQGEQDAGALTTVEIAGVAPGHYELEIGSSGGEPARVTAIDAGAGHDEVDLAAAQPLASLSGRAALSPPASPSAPLPTSLSIQLRPTQGGTNLSAHVDADGKFRMAAVRPGAYEVLAFAAGSSFAVKRLAAVGATVEGHLLKAGGEPIALTVTLAESTASVSGYAKRNGSPAPGVLLLLIPATPAAGEIPRRDQSDSDGSFVFRQVAAGEYTLVAIEDGWRLDWARTEVTARFLAAGVKVSVPARSAEIDLSEPLEVQSK